MCNIMKDEIRIRIKVIGFIMQSVKTDSHGNSFASSFMLLLPLLLLLPPPSRAPHPSPSSSEVKRTPDAFSWQDLPHRHRLLLLLSSFLFLLPPARGLS